MTNNKAFTILIILGILLSIGVFLGFRYYYDFKNAPTLIEEKEEDIVVNPESVVPGKDGLSARIKEQESRIISPEEQIMLNEKHNTPLPVPPAQQ